MTAYSPLVLGAMAAYLAELEGPKVPGWTAQPKQQIAWDLAETTFETLYGGSVGGGKSFFTAAYLVHYCLTHPKAHVGLVRKTLPMLKQTHGVDTLPMFTAGLARANKSDFTWTFANGSILRFISLNNAGDEQNYKSAQFDLLAFEEVTELTEPVYVFMLTRLRSASGNRAHVICTANPEGVGYAWVKRRWVKPKVSDLPPGMGIPEPCGVWTPPLPGQNYDKLGPEGVLYGPSRVYVPATIQDNPALLKAQPDYLLQIQMLPDARRRKALLDGDWDAMEQVPGALWTSTGINDARVSQCPQLARIVVAIDPAGTEGPHADQTGIIAAGSDSRGHGYVLADRSGKYGAAAWARAAIQLYIDLAADAIVIEKNAGAGTDSLLRNLEIEAAAMIRERIDPRFTVLPRIVPVTASRGKMTRAEPIAGLYLRGVVHHVGTFEDLEEQLTTWLPSSGYSPDRLDALVWALTELATPQVDKSMRRY